MRNRLITFLTPSFILSAVLIPGAFAGGITGPVSFPSAKVLPKKIMNFQYKGIYTQGTNKYSDGGNSESLGNSFDSSIKYQDLVENEETLQDQIFAEAKINNAPGIGLNDEMGRTTGEVNLAVNVHAPVFAVGLTSKWTMAVVVPVIQSELSVDVGSISSESLQGAVDYFAAPGQAMRGKIETVQQKFDNAVQNKLRDNGYDKLEGEKKTELGDIQLISKFNLSNNSKTRVTLVNSITMPTGKKSDTDKLIDIGSGDEQWDIGVGLAADRVINAKLTLSALINYTAQLAHTTSERIYSEDDSAITNQVDDSTYRDLGDIFQVAFAGNYKINDSLAFQTSYSFQMKGEDEYRGPKYQQSNYDYLEEETSQEMHAIQLGVTFDTITMYKKKEFMAPMEVGLGYTKPIAGKNVLTDGLVSANMSVYF
jgi:hypothetical protein